QIAEQSMASAKPELDQAKALDARIEALQPSHQQAASACEQAGANEAAAAAALRALQERRAALAMQREATATWLAPHQHWQTLAQSWPRWDVLCVQAGQAASQAEKLTGAHTKIQRNVKTQQAEQVDVSAGLAAVQAQWETAEVQRQDAMRALAALPA